MTEHRQLVRGGTEAIRGIAASTQRISKAAKQVLDTLQRDGAEAGRAA